MKENECTTLSDGRTLSHAEYGDPDGRPVLYFHGWPSSRYQAAFLDPLARKRGLKIYALDRPGIGHSTYVPKRSFSDWPKDVGEFCDTHHIGPFAILGISGGGPYTLASCASLSDRILRAAVVCGAPPLADENHRRNMHWAYRILSSSPKLRRMILPGLLPTSRWMTHRGPQRVPMKWILRSLPEQDLDALLTGDGWDMIIRSYLESIRNGPTPVLTDGELYLSDWDFRPENIQVKVRFWHGRSDANLPCDVVQQLAKRVPDAETCWMEGEGHYSLPVCHSGEVLDWLAQAWRD